MGAGESRDARWPASLAHTAVGNSKTLFQTGLQARADTWRLSSDLGHSRLCVCVSLSLTYTVGFGYTCRRETEGYTKKLGCQQCLLCVWVHDDGGKAALVRGRLEVLVIAQFSSMNGGGCGRCVVLLCSDFLRS